MVVVGAGVVGKSVGKISKVDATAGEFVVVGAIVPGDRPFVLWFLLALYL